MQTINNPSKSKGTDSQYKPCPRCGCSETKKIKYTLWGGHLGPKLTHRVRCQNCGKDYNGKTGRSIAKTIAIYTMAIISIVVILLLLFYYAF